MAGLEEGEQVIVGEEVETKQSRRFRW